MVEPVGGTVSARRTTDETIDERQELVTSNLELVTQVVARVASRFPRHVDRRELWNAGALGLVDAARRFDPSLGIPFPRYAAVRIRGAVIDATRRRDWTTRSVRRRMRELRQTAEDLRATHGREPDEDELAAGMGISRQSLADLRADARAASLLQLDQPVGTADGDLTLGDFVVESTTDHLPDEQLEQRELIGTLRLAVRHLPDVQREVIERYYTGGEYLHAIADRLGVTEARVSQIRTEALQAMRAYFATAFDGVDDVDEDAPGRRARTRFLERMADEGTWQRCIAAADAPMVVASA